MDFQRKSRQNLLKFCEMPKNPQKWAKVCPRTVACYKKNGKSTGEFGENSPRISLETLDFLQKFDIINRRKQTIEQREEIFMVRPESAVFFFEEDSSIPESSKPLML